MSGVLNHPPSDVIGQLLLDQSLAVSTVTSDWALFLGSIPDQPDKVIVVNDTAGRLDGKSMTDGLVLTQHGIQIIVRDSNRATGFVKANTIATTLDALTRETVTIESATYLIQAISRTGDIISLGRESPSSRRYLFSINAVTSLSKTS